MGTTETNVPAAPVYGPHDEDMDIRDFIGISLERIADTEEEKLEWARLEKVFRKEYKCIDVGSLMQLSKMQLESAATTAIGSSGAKGTVRMLLKYLGTKGEPHRPPELETSSSEALGQMTLAKDSVILFGRAGKSGVNSSEQNFPEAMRPSSSACTRAQDLSLPKPLQDYLTTRASEFNERHPKMPPKVVKELTMEITDWIVSKFGTSPVNKVRPFGEWGLVSV